MLWGVIQGGNCVDHVFKRLKLHCLVHWRVYMLVASLNKKEEFGEDFAMQNA